MKITTCEKHERQHHVFLSKEQVETILAEAIRAELGLPETSAVANSQRWTFTWGEETIDSGLRKVPQIAVSISENLINQEVEKAG